MSADSPVSGAFIALSPPVAPMQPAITAFSRHRFETMDWHVQKTGRLSFLYSFDMDKRHVILRDSNGFNVSNGRTSHRGVEYQFFWQAMPTLGFSAAGSFARHRYEFSSAVEGGETIESGKDVDTAPQQVHTASLQWQPRETISAEAEWLVVGDYWLDAANAHRYSGHELLNLRARYQFAHGWSVAARLNNALDRDYADRADFAFGSFRYFPGRDRTLFVELAWQR